MIDGYIRRILMTKASQARISRKLGQVPGDETRGFVQTPHNVESFFKKKLPNYDMNFHFYNESEVTKDEYKLRPFKIKVIRGEDKCTIVTDLKSCKRSYMKQLIRSLKKTFNICDKMDRAPLRSLVVG